MSNLFYQVAEYEGRINVRANSSDNPTIYMDRTVASFSTAEEANAYADSISDEHGYLLGYDEEDE